VATNRNRGRCRRRGDLPTITIWRWSVRMLALQLSKFFGERGIQFEVFPWF
jgi:hypothetical protein